MERHMQETIDECLKLIRDAGARDPVLHHGDVMHLVGYAAGLMHAGLISLDKWGDIRRLREEADRHWRENQ